MRTSVFAALSAALFGSAFMVGRVLAGNPATLIVLYTLILPAFAFGSAAVVLAARIAWRAVRRRADRRAVR